MNLLALKTDSQTASIFILEDSRVIDNYVWEAGRDLAKDLPRKIEELFQKNNIKKPDGFIGFLGPGSFTGLRIGLSAINALAYIYNAPIVGCGGDDWLSDGVKKLQNNENDKVLIPSYGAEAHITKPKK